MLFTFFTIHDLIRGEEILKREGLYLKIRPLPPEMTAGCGMGLEVVDSSLQRILDIFSSSHLTIKSIYREEDGEMESLYTEGNDKV